MPRGLRLDAPGVLQHVMARGIERRLLFRAAPDRQDFLRRLETLVEAAAFTIYAWALLPNHFHLLVRTGRRPLARNMSIERPVRFLDAGLISFRLLAG